MDLSVINYICSIVFVLAYWWKRSNGKNSRSVSVKFVGYSVLVFLIISNFVYQYIVASSGTSESVAIGLLASNANTILAFTGSIAGVEGIDNYYEYKDCKIKES